MHQQQAHPLVESICSNVNLLLDLLDRPIAFHKIYRQLTGSIPAALMLSYVVGLSDELAPSSNGWFAVDESGSCVIEDETGLTVGEQRKARSCLRQQGILAERHTGNTTECRVNFDVLANALQVVAQQNQETLIVHAVRST